jgi:hypothetical protein
MYKAKMRIAESAKAGNEEEEGHRHIVVLISYNLSH